MGTAQFQFRSFHNEIASVGYFDGRWEDGMSDGDEMLRQKFGGSSKLTGQVFGGESGGGPLGAGAVEAYPAA